MESTGSFTLLRQGFRLTSTKWGVLGVLYVLNLLITLPLALTFRSAMTAVIGEFPAIDELFGQFVYTIFTDITRVHSDAVRTATRSIGAVVIVSSVVHAVLGMGLVRVMQTDGSVREFFTGIVSFGWRGVRLLLVTLLVAAVLVGVALVLSMMIFGGFTEGNVTEVAYVAALSIGGILVGLAVSIVSLTAEYARISTVRNDRKSMFRSAWEGFRFVLRHPIRMLTLHGSVLIVLIVAIVLYWFIDDLIGATSMAGLLVMLVVQQGFVLVRMFARMWNTANGVGLMVMLEPARQASVVHAPSVHRSGTPQVDRAFQKSPGKTAPERRDARVRGGSRQGPQKEGGQRQGSRRRGRRRGPGRPQGGGQGGQKSSSGSASPASPQKKEGEGSRRRRPRRRRPPRSQGGSA